METGTDPPDSVRELLRQCDELRSRLEVVEARLGVAVRVPGGPRPEIPPAESAQPPGTAMDTSGGVALAGVSLLGLALAYLIRAAVETKAVAAAPGIAIGIVYSFAWLVWAARSPRVDALTISIRTVTAALILVPLVWEAQLRFDAASSAVTASVLVFFSAFGIAVSWRRNLGAIPAITSLAVLGAAGALLLATKDILPFAAVVLWLAAAGECRACLGRIPAERWIVAAASDLVVLLLTMVVTRPGGLPPAYVPMPIQGVLAVQIGLLAIYAAGTVARTLWRGFPIANLEIAQCAIAFALSVTGALQISNGRPFAVLLAGALCSLGAVLCYGVAFLLRDVRGRNFHAYASFGLALAIVATSLLASGPVRVSVWSVLAIAFVAAARKAGGMTLRWHACICLVLGSILSGAGWAAGKCFFGAEVPGAAPGFAACVATAAAATAYLMVARTPRPADPPSGYGTVCGILALCACWSAVGIAGTAMPPLGGSQEWGATVFTAILVLPALGFAFLGYRFERRELIWLEYSLLAAATAKLIAHDLGRGAKTSTVISLALYGGAMVLLPRVSRKPKAKAAAA